MSYQEQAMAGATGMELILALYDGALRRLYEARRCCEEGDQPGRRVAVKKVVDILMYLQARLRPDVDEQATTALSDFYAAMFTMTLEASHANAPEGFDEVIRCVKNVRDAWTVAAKDPAAGRVLPRELRTREERFSGPVVRSAMDGAERVASRWSA